MLTKGTLVDRFGNEMGFLLLLLSIIRRDFDAMDTFGFLKMVRRRVILWNEADL